MQICKASSLAEKELTTEYAKDVEHVTAVKNDMTIAKTVTTPGTTTGDKVDDASITAEVKAALLSQRSTCALQPKVSTKDGVVTLSGIAQNDAQKSLVTRLVADLNGVTSVINNMTEDSSITAQVKAALQSEGATSVLHITVSTADGVVSLSGMAKNDAGKSLAAKLATDINGVTSVINNMTVEAVAASNTRGLEAAYLAGGQARQAKEILDSIPPFYGQELTQFYNKWLAKRYPSREALERAWRAGARAAGPQMLRDGARNWDFWASEKSPARLETTNDSTKVTINAVDGTPCAYSDGCRTRIPISVGQHSDFSRTPFRFLSDSVPG